MAKLLYTNDKGEDVATEFDPSRVVYAKPFRVGTGSKVPVMYDLEGVGQVPLKMQTPVLTSQWGIGDYKGSGKNYNIDANLPEGPYFDLLKEWDVLVAREAVANRATWFPAMHPSLWVDSDISRWYKAVSSARVRSTDGAAFPAMQKIRLEAKTCGFFDQNGGEVELKEFEAKDVAFRAILNVSWVWIGDKSYSLSFYADQLQLKDADDVPQPAKKKRFSFA